jgi:CheY-like chemotaxis protein
MESKRVLLVDDNDATCALIAAVLHKDFAVESVSDGAEAIERIRTQSYSAILLDLKMPGIDGYGVLDFIAANQPTLMRNVLVVTAALTEREMSRASAYDICGIIRKPFDVEALLTTVKQCAGDPSDGTPLTNVFCSGPAVFLLLAEMFRNRW